MSIISSRYVLLDHFAIGPISDASQRHFVEHFALKVRCDAISGAVARLTTRNDPKGSLSIEHFIAV